jgi:ubiquinol-cytochrome c reductase iron-sulfur subunit
MRRVDLVVLGLLGLTALGSAGFIAVYVVSADTQLLGLSLGIAVLALAGALIIAGLRLVPQTKVVEERPQLGRSEPEHELVQLFETAALDADGKPLSPEETVSRRTLLIGAAGAAGALGAALVVPLASLGPKIGDTIVDTPWGAGVRLVDDQGMPIALDRLNVGGFLTAFPEGADKRELGSPIVVVRLRVDELDLPDDRKMWAPEGVMAYSKICPHAACAISLFRYPLYDPTSPGPALVCPCHYSTFDVTRGGDRIFGPAGRALPQLPLAVDNESNLIATGDFSGPIGPSYLSSRRT